MSTQRRMVIVVEGGVVQNVMTDKSMADVEVHLLDFDNLRGGQIDPTVELGVEVNPEQVELVISGEHEDVKKYVERNNAPEKTYTNTLPAS